MLKVEELIKSMGKLFEGVSVSDFMIAGIILVITFVLTKIISKIFGISKIKEALHIKFLKNLIVVILWFIGILMAMNRFEYLQNMVGTLLAGSGILAVILGLGAQESFANFFSGIFICLWKPFNIGDRIKVDGSADTVGTVVDITLRHTVIRTYTNIEVIIPNAVVGSAKIENSTSSIGASYPIEITVAYADDSKRRRAMQIMEEVVKSHPKFYKPYEDSTTALCIGYRNNGINLKILMWTEEFGDNALACSECRLEILKRFDEESIEVPYTKIELLK